MDSEIIWLILLFIILPLIEKIFRKRQQGADESPEPEYESGSLDTGTRPGSATTGGEKNYQSDLERLIAEELGLETPKPKPKPAEAPEPPPTRRRRQEISSAYTRPPRSASGAPVPRRKVAYPRSRVESRPPPPEPSYETLEVPPEQSLDAQAINLDERAIAAPREGGRVQFKKEVPRVAKLGVAGRERRSRPGLPDSPGWGTVKKAMVWSEILGPPKALRD